MQEKHMKQEQIQITLELEFLPMLFSFGIIPSCILTIAFSFKGTQGYIPKFYCLCI
jgi:hypothetical protein